MKHTRVTKTYSDCTLVNPLCPNDLCVLWYGHKGTAHGKHLLGTFPGSVPNEEWDDDPDDAEDHVQEVSNVMFMAPKGTPDDELIRLGWERADELCPDDRQ